jgi:hypothetical protein
VSLEVYPLADVFRISDTPASEVLFEVFVVYNEGHVGTDAFNLEKKWGELH